MDGSARVAECVLPTPRAAFSRAGRSGSLSFVVASWFRYLAGTDDRGRALPINDPMADRLGDLARQGGADPRPLLSVVELFGEILPQSPAFVELVAEILEEFYSLGAEVTLSRFVGS